LKGTYPGTIPARLGLIWFSSFRGEDLNVKVYDVRQTDDNGRTPSDGKSSPGQIDKYFNKKIPEKGKLIAFRLQENDTFVITFQNYG
jgi:hypothetical protein